MIIVDLTKLDLFGIGNSSLAAARPGFFPNLHTLRICLGSVAVNSGIYTVLHSLDHVTHLDATLGIHHRDWAPSSADAILAVFKRLGPGITQLSLHDDSRYNFHKVWE